MSGFWSYWSGCGVVGVGGAASIGVTAISDMTGK